MEIEGRLRLTSLLMLTCIREFRTLEQLFTTTNAVPENIQASLAALAMSTSFASAVTGTLEAMQAICSVFAHTESSSPQLSIYIRKAEISSLNFHMIEPLEDYPIPPPQLPPQRLGYPQTKCDFSEFLRLPFPVPPPHRRVLPRQSRPLHPSQLPAHLSQASQRAGPGGCQ